LKYTVTIPGEPTGKGRPRVTKWGTHTPEKTVLYENLIKLMAEPEITNGMLEGPLVMTIEAFYSIPKSASKKLREQMIRREVRPTKKPDTDNIAKTCGDALNGIWYKDDSHIVDEHVSKWYGEPACVVIEVEEWKL